MQLRRIADYFLSHNREIEHRCDDSVTRVFINKEYPIRRARGYAPQSIQLQSEGAVVLAVGGEQLPRIC